MPTARERAREAAISKAWDDGSEIVESGDERIADLADVASDVWEPLLVRIRRIVANTTIDTLPSDLFAVDAICKEALDAG